MGSWERGASKTQEEEGKVVEGTGRSVLKKGGDAEVSEGGGKWGKEGGGGNKERVGGRESVAGIYAHACWAKQHK